MNSAEKKEGDISKDKVRIVRTNFKAYISAGSLNVKSQKLYVQLGKINREIESLEGQISRLEIQKSAAVGKTDVIAGKDSEIAEIQSKLNELQEERKAALGMIEEVDAERSKAIKKETEEREAGEKKVVEGGGRIGAVRKPRRGAAGIIASAVGGEGGGGAAPPEGAPPGGGEGAAAAKVMTAEAKKQTELEKKQAAQSEILVKENEDKLKDLKSKFPSKSKIMLAFIIAVIYDFTDLVITIATGFQSEWGEWVADIPMYLLFRHLLGTYYTKARFNVGPLKKIPAPVLEFIPFLDLLPFYTHFVNQARKKLKDSHNEMDRLEEELSKLKGEEGGKKKKGFAGVSEKTWLILGAIFGPLTLISIFLFKSVVFAAVPIAILLFIIFIRALILMDKENRKTAIYVALVAFIIIGIALIFVFFIAPIFAGAGGPLGEQASLAAGAPTRAKAWLKEHNPITAIRNYYKKQLLIATGDYYTGKVDENAEAKLGVYLEDLKQADPVFYTDRQLIMFATLKVQTLDEPVNVKMYCKTEGLEGSPPTLFPKSEFLVDTYEEQDIDCMFEANSVRKGTWSFELGADFNFKTMSYVKSYFMDAERLRSMRREEIDPLEQYGIKDKSPTATYTVGPVGIGMGVGKPPVGIDSEQPQTTVTLGITIENMWGGEIIKLNRFIVIVPKGFTLEEIGAQKVKVDCSSLPGEEQALCDDELNNVYLVSDPTFVEVGKGNFKSYRGYLRLNRADYKEVLGMTPISTKYFKTTVGYTYRLKKTKIVEVKSREVAGIPGLVAGAGADVTPPTIEVGEPEVLGDGSIKITWETDEETIDNLVWWDVTRAPPVYPAKTTPGEAGFTKEHSRTLTEISSSKTYAYKITSTDKNGNMAEVTKTYPPS